MPASTTPGTGSSPRPRRYRRQVAPPESRCGYPGCLLRRKRGGERTEEPDLCNRHCAAEPAGGLTQPSPLPSGESALVPNDGIVDWQAIIMAARGERRVALTWVEYDIVIAAMLGAGLGTGVIADRTGMQLDTDSRRYRRLDAIGKGDADASTGTQAAA